MSAVGVAQALGRRERQEDAADVLMDASGRPRLLVLADGMGGAAAGDLAARLIVHSVRDVFQSEVGVEPGPRLRQACDAANAAIAEAVAQEPSRAGMGGTLVALAPTSAGAVMFLSVGDSLLLRWRGGKLERVNADHSIGGALDSAVRKGLMAAEEAALAAGRNRITSALTGAPLDQMRIDETVGPIRRRSGDCWILASDGLDTLSLTEIATVLARSSGAQSSADALIAAIEAKNQPHQDNTTVLVWQEA
ncbi:PP2C family protein-serine/threonine phosphatase [Brevundimonas lenta]|uniref:Serine/threonine protein phosphatase PrpC n=1 Tax=Brevundimonas lenta TaxID=424796 RepID=A0A7W6NN53_9CAUL|nr:protein phosphatase 2C domain-containing protein [Brevundimonas lenta]MBB4081423.1 serine/threonine protein phosphatase PrpC [Brevundimonas lenta]